MIQTINSVFKAQQAYKYTLRNSNATQRINKLSALKSSIQLYEKEIYAALQSDLRKSEFESALTEVVFIYSEIDYAIKNLSSWMRPVKVGKTITALMAKNRIYYEPKGVCLIISPWNYPFQLMMAPLISAIAAGNCAILKPSELSSETSSILCRVIEECFEESEICCFEGDAALSTHLLSLPFDHIFFTGSTAVGKIVMEAAAKNLTSLTLELGGKSPTLIDETANLDIAASKIAWGKLTNAGQTCIAPDYILIQESLQTAFLEKYKAAVQQMFFTETGELNLSSYAKIINEKHFNRIQGLVDDALSKGAKLPYGGPANKSTQTILPSVLTDLPENANIMKEEIFGPVLPIIPYKTIEEAITFVNKMDKPLALYIFSQDKKQIQQVIKSTSAGGTCVNDVLIHISNPKLPFGGVNGSGLGSCHGQFGFKTFSHERAVVFQSTLDMSKLIYPPYEKKGWVLKWLRKLM
ncbi:aldehyde dehydrogenase family protein [Pedobacter sp. N36a]|uniref:aldehyde dehydrogenase family protein n=1 Tax=Pedobacter sp. N36a TaxID=2767996 RepID=UPI001656B6B0|nr:aldehyde dehydrogenase family protein [Pedobacter sp. N36a]MBC8987151.1 aldehyde dehydrogenase family protein [Pedobacter sp. N36a]